MMSKFHGLAVASCAAALACSGAPSSGTGNDGGAAPGGGGAAMPGAGSGGTAGTVGGSAGGMSMPGAGAGGKGHGGTAGAGMGTGGASSASGGTSSMSSGGGEPITTGPWTAETENLAGLSSSCGTLLHVSSRPDRDMLIAGVVDNGLWANADGATSWTQLGGAPQPVANGVSSILYDPTKPDTFWESGTYGPCAYVTTDNGSTFSALGDATHCDSISVDFTDPARQTVLAGGHERHIVWRSTDGGQTWNDVGPNIPAAAGYTGFVLTLGSKVHLAATWNSATGGVFRSVDGGSTWSQVFTGPIDSRPLLASDSAIYWVLHNTEGTAGLIKSTDQGATWAKVAGSDGIISTEAGIAELPDGRFVTVGNTNLIISADHGATWNPVGPALPFSPWGVTYSKFRKKLFIWHFTCTNGSQPVAPDALQSIPFDSASQ